MSLISDALKTAQRERAGREKSGKTQPPPVDGFFPYVSSNPPRRRTRVLPILALSIAGIMLLGVAGWVALMKPKPVTASKNPAPIVLPPQVPVSKPALVDSSSLARNSDSSVAEPNTPGVDPRSSSAGRSGNAQRAAAVPSTD